MKNNKIYRYGDKYYSIEELYEIYNKVHFDNKKAFKDCLCHYILKKISMMKRLFLSRILKH